MKRSYLVKCAAGSAFSVSLLLGVNAHAQDYSKSSRPWGMYKQVEKTSDLEALPADASVAMACAKCKSVVVMSKKDMATKPGHGQTDSIAVVDKCPGCGGKITRKESGKETQLQHVCSKCGADSAYCCASTGDGKTEGM
jgi:predicted RNA-binding Zn-ribbon protein involved in translation (DUF1610 family)